MTHEDWMKKTTQLKRSIASLRGHARSGRNDLAKKLTYLNRLKAQSENLRQHQLNYHSLVTE